MGGETRSRPVRVGELLVQAVPQLRERLLEVEIRQVWPSVAGPELGRRSRPGELKGGILSVAADNSPCLQELGLRSAELLAALQARYGQTVTGLRFTLEGARERTE
jgi:predicted nucleic acid-binding Zn ribbon protein